MSVSDYVVAGRCGCCGKVVDNYWTPERMIDALHAWIAEHGSRPGAHDWRHGRPGNPPQGHVCKVFGKWNNLFRAAGVEPFKPGQRPWSKDDIASAMLDHVLRTGRWPRVTDWNSPRGDIHRPHYRTVLMHFPTWDAAKTYAGWTGGTAEAPAEVRCSECDTGLDNETLGCTTCRNRHGRRTRRARLATSRQGSGETGTTTTGG